jgi:hypothetical protein
MQPLADSVSEILAAVDAYFFIHGEMPSPTSVVSTQPEKNMSERNCRCIQDCKELTRVDKYTCNTFHLQYGTPLANQPGNGYVRA